MHSSSKKVCDSLLVEGSKVGIDPRDIFMNGTINVMSGFAIGIIYDSKVSMSKLK